jgi:hypothetical protein
MEEKKYQTNTGEETPHFLRRHLNIKCIILPRQARDKHRESAQTMSERVSLAIALSKGVKDAYAKEKPVFLRAILCIVF